MCCNARRKIQSEGRIADLEAENARLRERYVGNREDCGHLKCFTRAPGLLVEGCEVCVSDHYRALAERRGEALMEYGNHHSSCILEHHAPGVRDCGCGYVAALRAAIAATPDGERR